MRTKLMSKLFSETCPEEFKENVLECIDEAHENGSATLEMEDGEDLQFTEVDGDIIVEDIDNGESTRFSENPDDANDFVMTPVEGEVIPNEMPEEPAEENAIAAAEAPEEIPTNIEQEDETGAHEERVMSEANPSIKIDIIEGPDGEKADDIIPDFTVDIDNGIEDECKSGTKVCSLKFKNFSKKKAMILSKIFSELVSPLDELVENAEVDEDVEVKFNEDGEMRVMSLHVGKTKKKKTRKFSESDIKDQVEEISDAVDELNEEFTEGVTEENAEELVEKANEIIKNADELTEQVADMADVDVEEICESCKKFSIKAKRIRRQVKSFSKKNKTKAKSKRFSKKAFTRKFSDFEDAGLSEEMLDQVEEISESLENLESQAAEVTDEIAEEDAQEIVDSAQEVIDSTAEILDEIEDLTGEEVEEVRESCKKFSQTADDIISQISEDKLKPAEGEEGSLEPTNIPETAEFSDTEDGTVDVTINGLKPASVASLLGDAEDDELQPVEDPNSDDQNRQFSVVRKKSSMLNPLLYTEIK